METQVANTKKSTLLLKNFLQQKYGVKFSVKTEKYANGSSMRIEWTLGPDDHLVSLDTAPLQQGTFDGMTDSYDYNDNPPFIIDGFALQTYKYVFVTQIIPEEFRFIMLKALSSRIDLGLPKLKTIQQMDEQFKENYNGAWTWNQLFNRITEVKNFITDDMKNIEIVNVARDPERPLSFVFYYTYNGGEKIYNTNQIPEVEKETKKEELIIERGETEGIEIVDYSQKAIAVIGNTKPIKDKLMKINGRYNRFLKINGQTTKGWIFPKTKYDLVRTTLEG